MMKVAVASGNPAKVNAVKTVLMSLEGNISTISIETESGVSAQPMSLAETRQGAVNRAQTALEQSGADVAVGLEGGVFELQGTMYLCNYGALADSTGALFTAGGAQIPLPDSVAEKVKAGTELGPVMDEFANETGVRLHKGAVGILTAGFLNRQEMFEQVVRLLAGQYKFARDSVASRQDEL